MLRTEMIGETRCKTSKTQDQQDETLVKVKTSKTMAYMNCWRIISKLISLCVAEKMVIKLVLLGIK